MAKYIEEYFRYTPDGKLTLVWRYQWSSNREKNERISHLKRLGFFYDPKIASYKCYSQFSDVLYLSCFSRIIHSID